jgi:hypothetical protein
MNGALTLTLSRLRRERECRQVDIFGGSQIHGFAEENPLPLGEDLGEGLKWMINVAIQKKKRENYART